MVVVIFPYINSLLVFIIVITVDESIIPFSIFISLFSSVITVSYNNFGSVEIISNVIIIYK